MLVNGRYISVKVNEPELRERNEALYILLEISNFLAMTHSIDEVLEGSLSRVLEHFGFKAGRIYLMDSSRQNLLLAACKGIEPAGLERVRIDEGFSGLAARTRSFIALKMSDLEDKTRAAFLMSKGLEVIICVPLIAMDELVGVMNLAAEESFELDRAKIDLLISIGNQFAVAVNNARLYEVLNAKIKELKMQKEAIEFFAYSISHDLRSPAIGIYGLTRRLHKLCCTALMEKGLEYCRQIIKASEQIVNLIDKINAYIVVKEAPMHFEKLEVKEITEIIKNEFSETLSSRAVKWSEPEMFPAIVADKMSVIRVLRNLVDNALKYGGQDLGEIKIGYLNEEKSHIIFVSDDGVGVDKASSEKLFELYKRHKTSRGIEGAGLGLAIVKEIAERHGGRAWLDTDCRRGTTFYISISKDLESGGAGDRALEASAEGAVSGRE